VLIKLKTFEYVVVMFCFSIKYCFRYNSNLQISLLSKSCPWQAFPSSQSKFSMDLYCQLLVSDEKLWSMKLVGRPCWLLSPVPCYVFTFVQTRPFYAKKSIEPAPFVREIEPLVSIDCDLSAERFRDDQNVSDFGSVRPGKNSVKSFEFQI
jgi:hypothetical protein